AMVSRTGRFQSARPSSISYSASNTNHIAPLHIALRIAHATLTTDARASPSCEAAEKTSNRRASVATRRRRARNLASRATLLPKSAPLLPAATDVAFLSPLNLLEYTMLKTAFVAACVLAVSG